MNTYLITWREKFSMKREDLRNIDYWDDDDGNLYQTSFFEQPFKGKYPSRAIQKWSRLWDLKESDCIEFKVELVNEKES
jgi:hypothetical protein